MASGPKQTNLSGAWRGLYNFPRSLPPVHFEADLAEAGGWLTGIIRETIIHAGNPIDIGAQLQGKRTGHAVTWLKIYDPSPATESGYYDSVQYEGQLNEEATEITGTWRIPGSWQGTFLMIRPAALEIAEQRATLVPITP